jgi:DNA-binding transcriptional regulator YiaG
MTDDPLCASLLRQAKSIAGSIEVLARYLHVPKKQLSSWIDGEVETPCTVLLRAVDFLRHPPQITR